MCVAVRLKAVCLKHHTFGDFRFPLLVISVLLYRNDMLVESQSDGWHGYTEVCVKTTLSPSISLSDSGSQKGRSLSQLPWARAR